MTTKFQRQLATGTWTDETDETYINSFLDRVLARETWFAPRVEREPMTTREQVLAYLATGKTLQYGDDWYATVRDGNCWEKLPVVKESYEQLYQQNPFVS